MNIFFLDPTPQTCAEYHCNAHVVKMIIEYAQLMSTAHRVLDGAEYTDFTKNNRRIKRWRMDSDYMESGLMKASHVNHPSNIWVRNSKQNYIWLNTMWNHLLSEYTLRYNKVHACEKYKDVLANPPKNIPDNKWSEPTPAMPKEYIVKNSSVASYHKYYINDKSQFAKWTNRIVPHWFLEGVTKNANL